MQDYSNTNKTICVFRPTRVKTLEMISALIREHKKKCVNPPSLTFGTANESSAPEGSSVIYMCDNGYDSVVDITSTCNADGNWTAPSSHCLRGVLRSK
ncbi:hypothetical protein CHS0354_025274 [Potamilus streckersoni]|uniref:Sushi domain-containing protein n=1 Tax=Potamilus streckersoni TaxID=2493646 RepID=A0AAE0RS27_9BIVA|nr:hypothetical protein CHS0354_025274 [Potamilus streckersoni]